MAQTDLLAWAQLKSNTNQYWSIKNAAVKDNNIWGVGAKTNIPCSSDKIANTLSTRSCDQRLRKQIRYHQVQSWGTCSEDEILNVFKETKKEDSSEFWYCNTDELRLVLQTHGYCQNKLCTARQETDPTMMYGQMTSSPWRLVWHASNQLWSYISGRTKCHTAKIRAKHLLTCFFPCFGNPSWFKISLSSFILKYASLSCDKQGSTCEIFKSAVTRCCAREVHRHTCHVWSMDQKNRTTNSTTIY